MMTILSLSIVNCRDCIEPGGNDKICNLIGAILSNLNAENIEVLRLSLLLAKIATKSENNKGIPI